MPAALRSETPAVAPRIVVLPFKNLGSATDEYVAAGITEEITSRLAAAQGVRVVSPASTAGRDYVLEGTVLWDTRNGAAERVRITAQLIRVDDDTHIWAETFDREIADLFAVQSEIAVRVVREMRSTLLAAEHALVSARPTENLEAYRSYLQGLFYLARPDFSEEGMAKPIPYLQRASDLDPHFARAHAALARAHLSFYQFGHDTSPDRLRLASRALERAKAAGSPSAEISRAEIQYWLAVRPDPKRALAALAAAEAQRPQDASMFESAGSLLLRLGRWDDAAAKLAQARTLNPQNAFVHAQLAVVLTGLRRYSDAQQAIEQSLALERDQQLAYIVRIWATWLAKGDLAATNGLLKGLPKPDDWRFMELRWLQALYERRFDRALEATAPFAGRWMRTMVLARPVVLLEAQAWQLSGDRRRAADAFAAARTLLETEVRATPEDGRLRSSLGIAYAGLGRKDDALREARRALELMPFPAGFDTSVVREDVALVATMSGEHGLALRELQTLLASPAHFSPHLLRLDPRWDALRPDPRYRDLGVYN